MLCGLLLALAVPLATPAADTLVICPDAFRAELRPWLDYRQEQGHRAVVLPSAQTAGQLRAQIRAHAAGARFLVLVGDAAGAGDRGPHPHCVPTGYVPAKVNLRFGSEPEIA